MKLFVASILFFLFFSSCAKRAKVVIRFANAEGVEQLKIMREICKNYEKLNPGVKINIEWGVRKEKILVTIAGGSPPDVFMWWCGITDLVERGVLLPLNEYIEKYNIDLSQYFGCLVEQYTYDGKIYALPLQLKTFCLAYNKNIFDRENIPYPDETWTWDTYFEVAKKLTKDLDGDGIRDQFGTVPPWMAAWVLFNGGGIVDIDTKKCIVDSSQTKEALRFLEKLYHSACPSVAERDAIGGFEGFIAGKVAMMVIAGWELAYLRSIKKFEWEIAPLPKPPNRKLHVVFDDACLCIPRGIKYPEEAFKFAAFYCGKEGMRIFATGKNGIPANKEAAYSVFLEPPPYKLKYFLDAAEIATRAVYPKIKNYDEILQPLQQCLDLVYVGKKTFDDKTIFEIKEETEEVIKKIYPPLGS